MISPGSIPLNIKVSRDVVFTLQKKLFILTVVRGYIRCEMTPTSVGGEQQIKNPVKGILFFCSYFFCILLLNYYQNVTFKPPEIVRIGVYLSVEAVV